MTPRPANNNAPSITRLAEYAELIERSGIDCDPDSFDRRFPGLRAFYASPEGATVTGKEALAISAAYEAIVEHRGGERTADADLWPRLLSSVRTVCNDDRCGCGASLAHVAGGTLCPECDRDDLEALTSDDVAGGDAIEPEPPLSCANVARPTDRQLALAAMMLSRYGCANAVNDEHYQAATATVTWLQLAAWDWTQATACMTHAVACMTHATAATSAAVDLDWEGRASRAASIAAKAAARDAIAAGADPLIVVDAALHEIARFRELRGVSAKYVAHDPLAALVVELRHKRVPSQFARVVGALGRASEQEAQMKDGYDDGHERPLGDWSLSNLLDLVQLATFEGTPQELAEKAIEEAERIAGMLTGWQEAIADMRAGPDGTDMHDPRVRAEIERAADGFIAGLRAAQ